MASQREARARWQRDQLQTRLRATISNYPYGAALPATPDLAEQLGELPEHVRVALMALETAGEIARCGGRRAYRYRLRPEETHPQDADFDRAVRAGIATGRYAPGSPLPTGLLRGRHGVASLHVARACRLLIADRLVTFRRGHAGPGYYVVKSPNIASQAAATRKEEGKNRV
ncbi:hypothetical protein [Streptomyces sp. NBC_01237]|uniref:hypothetical protein n=1 Tax=Streptomyces sp. NBC_01237 TaxID=2903790 RepID=UPI002DD8E3A8|nr:hypothetical protein [Streptomyces sp. NBC_01237]WRZ77196.1 GntR family transcriptional regulator [Streptomyces sp. NBC_01237]